MANPYNLTHSPLFKNLSPEDISSVISCFGGSTAAYQKGEEVVSLGDPIGFIATLLEGKLIISKEDAGGNRSLLTRIHPGEHFAEVFAFSNVTQSPVSVLCEEPSSVLFLPTQHFLPLCQKACPFHSKIVENLLIILSSKALYLQNRMNFLSEKNLSQKILSFLSHRCPKTGVAFPIPFNREELADYLCVDRSALSRELSKLKKQGLIDFHKNQFTLFHLPF